MNYESIKLTIDGKIAIVTINRPESLNALNAQVLNDLEKVFDYLDSEKTANCVIVTGSGEKSFVAGADIKEFPSFTQEQATELSKRGHFIFNKIENLSKPVIAAVNGFALGGGLELAMSCHIRYASENAKLGLPEVTLGLIPGYGGTQRLPKLVGKGIANEMIFSAKMITAEKAKSIGLVNEVFPLEELLPKTKELAEQIIKNSPQGIAKAIKAVNASDSENGMETEINSFGDLFAQDDFKEGVSAFIEKRKPIFN
ncbi:enoyl-CoA hydratase/isomerase family protein [Epilithonimonas hungarica]|jgi:Enoyl-CoA hydratase/carnithine racemase|uniref:Enoyl-CoA hydratase n=1 Tax=Epilithonimonas hungarica TaxID=454006 RepID=A0A1G7FVL5_9FLAO|nr:enoyl-CoA hydratase-related protein [Epilithonimonas hungarica]SDE79929.1 enoyl-CoA hydratase [Epilithonimonas hungarica]